MHTPRRSPAFIAFGISGAVFAGVATTRLTDSPLIAVLLAAQAFAIAAVAWIVRDARRSRQEVTGIRAEVGALRQQTAEIHDWMKQLDASSDQVATAAPIDDLMEARLRKLMEDSGPIPVGMDKESIQAARRISRALNAHATTHGDRGGAY